MLRRLAPWIFAIFSILAVFGVLCVIGFLLNRYDPLPLVTKVEAQSPQKFQFQRFEKHNLNGQSIYFWAACYTPTGTLMLGSNWDTGGGVVLNGCQKDPR